MPNTIVLKFKITVEGAIAFNTAGDYTRAMALVENAAAPGREIGKVDIKQQPAMVRDDSVTCRVPGEPVPEIPPVPYSVDRQDPPPDTPAEEPVDLADPMPIPPELDRTGTE